MIDHRVAGITTNIAPSNVGAARRGLSAAAQPGSIVVVATALRRFGGDIAFVGFVVGIAALRWQVINGYTEPSGLDPGNWLAFGHSILGSRARSASIVYPPVVPLTTLGFAALWGPLKGSQILALIASLAPAAGTYVLLRRAVGIRAVVIAGMLAPAATTGEAAAWGGFPQLVGLGLLPLVIWALDRYITDRQRKWAWATSILLLLTLLTSDLIGVMTVAAIIVFVTLRTLVAPSNLRLTPRQLTVGALICLVPLAAALPIYGPLVSSVLGTHTTVHSSRLLTSDNFQPTLDNLFKDNLDFWQGTFVVTLLAPISILPKRSRTLAVAATAILLPTLGALLVIREGRFFFLLPTAIALSLAAWWSLLADRAQPSFWWAVKPGARHSLSVSVDQLVMVIMVLALLVESYAGISTFRQQVAWYNVLDPQIVAGFQRLDVLAPRKAVLAVGPGPGRAASQEWPFGWWVEGLLNRPTYYTSDLDWLNFADERRRATLANEMFSSADGLSGAISLARLNGIGYLVVAKGWPGYRAWISTAGSLGEARVVVETPSILVVSVDG